jgi:hypothetical protein
MLQNDHMLLKRLNKIQRQLALATWPRILRQGRQSNKMLLQAEHAAWAYQRAYLQLPSHCRTAEKDEILHSAALLPLGRHCVCSA